MTDTGLRERLGGALRQALRSRDAVAVSALRSALAALDNAEAAPDTVPEGSTMATHPRLAGTVVGVGSAEVPRRILRDNEQRAVMQAEIDERLSAAAQFDVRSRPDRAARLRAEATVLAEFCSGE